MTKDLPKWKMQRYTDFQRGIFVASIMWMFALMFVFGIQYIMEVWLAYFGITWWLSIVGFVALLAGVTFFAVRFLNWLFRKLYVSRYRIFPGR